MAEETTADRVRRRREAIGMTQAEVANKFGISPEGYGHYERGRSEFTESQLRDLASILRVRVSFILGEEDEEEFSDHEAAIYYNGLPPVLKPAARAALKALYDEADRVSAASVIGHRDE